MAWLTGPTIALNLTFLLLPVASALGGWVGARAAGAAPWGAFATGALCAFSAWTFNTLANGQLEQVPLGGAALVWGLLVRATRPGAPASHALAPALATLAVGLAAPHVGLAALVGVALLLPLRLVAPSLVEAPRIRREPVRRPVIPLLLPAVGIAVAAALVHAWHAPQFGEGVHVFAPKGAVTSQEAGPEIPGVFEVATLARLFLPPELPSAASRGVAHCAYLGWVPLLAAVVAGMRAGGARAWGILAAALAIAALGDHVSLGGFALPLPAAWYGELSVALSRSANPYRLVLGAVAALALAAGSRLRSPRLALLLVALAWIEVGATRTRAIPLPSQPWAPLPSTVALTGGAGPVLDIPLASPACPDVGWGYATEAMWHGRPVPVTLRFDWRAWGTLEGLGKRLARTLTAPDCASRLPPLLVEGGFTAIVLHSRTTCAVPPGAAACLTAALGPATEGDGVSWWERAP